MQPSNAPSRGFTLIELLVALAIAALIAALALPVLSRAQAKAELRSTADQLAAGLRAVRGAAMAHGRSEIFVLDVRQGVFRAGAAAPGRVTKAVRLALVTATQERIDAETGSIRFFPDGTSTGGGIALSEAEGRVLVLVDWLTGRVSIAAGAGNAPPR